MPRVLVPAVFLLLLPLSTLAATINIGLITFDPFLPGPDGTNIVNITNFTADFALPPDFPVLTPLTFLSGTLTLSNGEPLVIPLGDLAPGPLTLPGSLEFPDTATFSSALFTATLSQTSFLLSDGTTFQADSPAIVATLVPSEGPTLTPGIDFAVLSVTGEVSTVIPEPASLLLLGTALATLAAARRIRRVL
ncbi:MAG: PEP-CTERM sorting domain-containing protein [Bryobacteraceae bacterium]|nr:PEP-CTERM sorting domain-containing protein [Bryobacteraceae bacterium]